MAQVKRHRDETAAKDEVRATQAEIDAELEQLTARAEMPVGDEGVGGT